MLQIFLLCVNYIYFWRYQSIGFEGIVPDAKKGITEYADSAAFTFSTWQISSCSPREFISPEATVINLFANVWVFLVGLDNSSDFFGFFVEAR